MPRASLETMEIFVFRFRRGVKFIDFAQKNQNVPLDPSVYSDVFCLGVERALSHYTYLKKQTYRLSESTRICCVHIVYLRAP